MYRQHMLFYKSTCAFDVRLKQRTCTTPRRTPLRFTDSVHISQVICSKFQRGQDLPDADANTQLNPIGKTGSPPVYNIQLMWMTTDPGL